MAREAWGRWGEADQAGALNFMTPDTIRAAAGLVRQGRMLSLAQPLSKHTPIPQHRAPLQHFMDRDGGDYAAGARRPGGFQFAEDSVVMSLHMGTHIDGLCHAWCDDLLYNGHSGNTITSTAGAKKCGIDTMPPIFTRGVLLDVAECGPVIGRADLIAAASRAGVTPGGGDAVLLHTGWMERQADHPRGGIDFNTEPGIDIDAALWLAKADVALIGADNFAIEAMPFPDGQIFPVHQRLIRDFGIPLLENMVLADLTATGVAEFLFVAAPLPIVGGTGSPLTPLAIF